jgi:hypothetical protein
MEQEHQEFLLEVRNYNFMMDLIEKRNVTILKDGVGPDGYYALLKIEKNIIPIPVFKEIVCYGSEMVKPFSRYEGIYPKGLGIINLLEDLGVEWEIQDREKRAIRWEEN